MAQGIPDWALFGGLLIAGYVAYKEGIIQKILPEGQKFIDDLFKELNAIAPLPGGGDGNGGGDGQGE
jgi:hypothetical protein